MDGNSEGGGLLRVGLAVTVAVVINLVFVTAFGWLLVTHSAVDAPAAADAVIVLGGNHDGRELFGVEVARQVGAHTVVLSDPYAAHDRVMRELCGTRRGEIEIICRTPVPDTTRGEAIFARQLAQARGWKRIVVVSWRYHLPRARIVFRQCYSADPAAVLMMAVPGKKPASLTDLFGTYEYQYLATMKALAERSCDDRH